MRDRTNRVIGITMVVWSVIILLLILAKAALAADLTFTWGTLPPTPAKSMGQFMTYL